MQELPEGLLPFAEDVEAAHVEQAQGHTEDSGETPRGEDTLNSNARQKTQVQGPMKFAYELPPQDMKRLTPVSFDSCPLALWRLLAQQGLLQMFLKHKV